MPLAVGDVDPTVGDIDAGDRVPQVEDPRLRHDVDLHVGRGAPAWFDQSRVDDIRCTSLKNIP